MELLYNPDAMSEQEIKATFVARQPLVDKLITMIERQPNGAGVQHVVIIAPRGMGKTTVLLMVKFTLKDRGLTKNWQAVKFPEESYGIYDLADFWIQTLELLAVETGDDAPRVQAEELKRKYPNNDDLQEAALAALKDWRRKHKKRIVLLVENFDMILEQINDEQDNARLRDVLMNDGTMMLIGGATTFFKEARAYDQPLYNFFQIENLADLKFEQMQQLLRSRAAEDALPNFDATLKANIGRLRTLEYFTGGNPRLVLMLYRVVTQSDLSEVRRGLEKLLDEVTPYYKAKIEVLPPQQRKILDHIARISGKTNEGLTPAEIAEAVRLSPNQTSAQLKRLSELGYVRAINMRGRSVPYTLAEPLYAIWHQMRFGRDAREKMQWLVRFLKFWYDREEMEPESEKLGSRFRTHLASGRMREARDTLEHHRYLAEAMESAPSRARAMEKVIQGHLEIGDGDIVRRNLLTGINLEELSEETLDKLIKSGCVSKEAVQQAVKLQKNIGKNEYAELIAAAELSYFTGKAKEALQYLDKALIINPDDHEAWNNRGIVLRALGKPEEAIASYDKALAINPDDHEAWYNRGIVLRALGKPEEAIASYDKALAIKPDKHEAWYNRGLVYLGKFIQMLQQGATQQLLSHWREALESGKKSQDQEWPDVISNALIMIIQMGHLTLAQELLRESQLEAQLFPLARAIDYLQTGDESLIERLSPEVKGIVEEVVAKLRPVAKNTRSPKTKTKKS